MANYEATRYDFDGANLTGVQGVNTGLIIPWSSGSVPSGFLECDGSAVSRSTYAALFAVVGVNYGVGDGSTTFNLPDLQDKVCVHKSPTKAMYSSGGADTVAATGNVTGAAAGNTTIDVPTLAAHTHTVASGFAGNYGPGGSGIGSQTGLTGGGGAHGHSVSSANFTGSADSVLQPYITMIYIIKT
jgi:microcystin-dependent protein